MYNKLLVVEIDNLPNKIIFNKKLIYDIFKINEFSITYNCIYINNELLKNIFPNLTDDDRLLILKTYGTYYNDIKIQFPNLTIDNPILDMYYINIYQWTNFMVNIKNNPLANKLNLYYPYIDFNVYYALINQPNIKLISEIVFLDDIEREKFANTKLEYIIETIDTDIYNFKVANSYDCEFSFTKPCKELIWYIQPQIYYNNFNNNGKNKDLLFDISKLSSFDFINNQQIYLNNLQILLLTDSSSNNYYNYLLSYKYFNNILPSGIYYHSFCLYPEETQPSGTANLRYIKGKNYMININNQFINDYNKILSILDPNNTKPNLMLKFISKNYEMLIIHKGLAKFLYV